MDPHIQYCSACGETVSHRVPEGDKLRRPVCDNCGVIHYQNPRIVAGCVVEHEGEILICRRSIQPRAGFWTLPAGFMEKGETMEQAAAREALEEAEAEVRIDAIFALVDVPHVDQVHVMYRGGLARPGFAAGHETLEAIMVQPEDIPWDAIAFPSVEFTLRRYIEDRERGRFGVHETRVERLRERR